MPAFEPGGPREHLYFDPAGLRAGIVTCGGLCPGLNNVIRGLVHGPDGFLARLRRRVERRGHAVTRSWWSPRAPGRS
jgi:hypothetical protein